MNNKVKKVTLQSLATTVEALSTTVETLSTTVEAGFKRMDRGFKEAKEDNESLARMVANGFEHTATKEDLVRLEQGQENIQLRIDSLAPQFEVKQLERRVKRLEDKAGIRHTITR